MSPRQTGLRVLGILIVLAVILGLVDRRGARGRRATAMVLAAELADSLKSTNADADLTEAEGLRLNLAPADSPALESARQRLLDAPWIHLDEMAPPALLQLSPPASSPGLFGLSAPPLRLSLKLSSSPGSSATSKLPLEKTHAFIGAFALAPPLLAILLAFATRRLTPSLVSAILLASVLAQPAGVYTLGIPHALVAYTWTTTLLDPFKLWILVFTTALIGLVGVAQSAGGVQGIVDRLTRYAKGRRATMAATTLMGLCIFFDDYANTILVGTTMRPLTDRLLISREKLAYLVDSTSAPVAGVALISTWIGYEVGLFTDLAHSLGLSQDGYQLFFSALPFRFYCIFTLGFLSLLLLLGRDFGPMLKAERRALHTGAVLREGARPLSGAGLESLKIAEGIVPRAHIALLPIGLTLGGTLLGLLWDGGGLPVVQAHPLALFSLDTWRQAFGAAEHSTFILAMASLAGSLLVVLLVIGERLLSAGATASAYLRGVRSMSPAVLILLLAWAIKAGCDDVGTSAFLVAWLQESLSPQLLPALIFLLAALVAFATGTSWGTMGILIPTAVPLAYQLGGEGTLFIAAAAVLDGAIFGDHCSPISDTTVMSSIASGCDHLDHVRTQIPYALSSMGVALLGGYLWWGFGAPYPLGILIGFVALALILRLAGRRPEEAAVATPAPTK